MMGEGTTACPDCEGVGHPLDDPNECATCRGTGRLNALDRAMIAVNFLLDYSEDTHDCKTCSKGEGVQPSLEPHDEECPLVRGGFVTREGKRL